MQKPLRELTDVTLYCVKSRETLPSAGVDGARIEQNAEPVQTNDVRACAEKRNYRLKVSSYGHTLLLMAICLP